MEARRRVPIFFILHIVSHGLSVDLILATKKRLSEFPDAVKSKIGYILEGVQVGRTSNKIKRLSGFSGVYEIMSDYASVVSI